MFVSFSLSLSYSFSLSHNVSLVRSLLLYLSFSIVAPLSFVSLPLPVSLFSDYPSFSNSLTSSFASFVSLPLLVSLFSDYPSLFLQFPDLLFRVFLPTSMAHAASRSTYLAPQSGVCEWTLSLQKEKSSSTPPTASATEIARYDTVCVLAQRNLRLDKQTSTFTIRREGRSSFTVQPGYGRVDLDNRNVHGTLKKERAALALMYMFEYESMGSRQPTPAYLDMGSRAKSWLSEEETDTQRVFLCIRCRICPTAASGRASTCTATRRTAPSPRPRPPGN